MPTVIGDWLFITNRTGKFYALDAKGRTRFAVACGTSPGYVVQLINGVRPISAGMAIKAEIASDGKLRAEELSLDTPWDQWHRVRTRHKPSAKRRRTGNGKA